MVNFDIGVGPPATYIPPSWPSLAWVAGPQPIFSTAPVLWYREDMLFFIMLWTIVVFFAVFTIAGLVALLMFHRHRAGLFLLIGFAVYGVSIGAASGAIVGAMLSSFYVTGFLSMPTWVPLAWAIIQAGIAAIFSFSKISMNAA
ncbi:hypothetical protein BC831DRAFT_450559 [Entophlyctis helioformis]|nr:hypothetical protein BC831DRAFT_450559 [Entophlyctis helioformis]